MKDAYTLGIRSRQASESINSTLKAYLNCKLDIYRFLEHFDRVLDERREKDIKSEYDMTSKLSRIKFNVPIKKCCQSEMTYIISLSGFVSKFAKFRYQLNIS
jgi:hypothetical protein